MTRDIATRMATYVGAPARAILPAVHDVLVIIAWMLMLADAFAAVGAF